MNSCHLPNLEHPRALCNERPIVWKCMDRPKQVLRVADPTGDCIAAFTVEISAFLLGNAQNELC
jgi:hypothetical protein